MADEPLELAPEVEVACDACGEVVADVLAGADELASQAQLARRFHRARLARRSRGALEERASFTHDYATSLLACRTCDLVYRSPRPTADAVLEVYERERYAPERLPQMIASQRALFRPRARTLARSLGRGARVLEVGSFVGGFLREARRAGLEATGLDPSEQLVKLCRSEGLHVVRDTIEDFTARRPLPRYDAIAIWNTFDQLTKPRSALAAALRVLRSDGVILLRFPHGACYRRLVDANPLPIRALAWNNLLGFPYLHGYGLRSIDALATPFGLVCTRVAGDALGAVADRSYARWARTEEQLVKRAQRRRWRRDIALAPWLEVELRLSPPTES